MANLKNELKESAFAMFITETYSDVEIAKRLSVNVKTVGIWKRQFYEYLAKSEELQTNLNRLNKLRLESAIADILTAAKLQERALTSDEIGQVERIRKVALKLY